MEIWRGGDGKIGMRNCNRVWKGEKWPDSWKEGVIVPIVKKGEGEKIEQYRGDDVDANFI